MVWLLPCSCSLNRKTSGGQQDSTVFHILHGGQSLGEGSQSLPLVTTAPTGYGNFRFSMGTHTWRNNYGNNPESRPDSLFTFVPLTAVQLGGIGETIGNGVADHLRAALQKAGRNGPRFLFSYAGQGGRYIRELNKRHDDAKDPRAAGRQSAGGYYRTAIDDVRRARRQALQMGRPYQVLALTWMQGEANGTLRLNRWEGPLTRQAAMEHYREDLVALKEDLQQDVQAITGQQAPPPFFMYQTAGNMAGIAQFQASEMYGDMYLVAPTYMLPNAENGYYYSGEKRMHGDGIHLTADGERWLGEQFGKVISEVMFSGKNWKPLHPKRAWLNAEDGAIYIRFHVPAPPLVLDTAWLPAQQKGCGFDVFDSGGNSIAVEKVEIAGEDLLKLRLNNPGKAMPASIQYGLNSRVADLSLPVAGVRQPVTLKDGHEGLDVIFDGDLLAEVAALRKEGVFYIGNIAAENIFTNLIIREVFLDAAGQTVMRGELKDLRNNVPFQKGQRIYTARRYAYGNLRDSDNRQSVFTFSDTSYGTRQGQKYPLYNYCITFEALPVGGKE
ncbi:phosphate ABC transporter substrate-binding protein [Chitinophaga alhagiae]|uniref:Phosphate ABC transporter substrate-binding protein n=1 Tax=Chitinophaga alhagiae TaxID=2203219 RepID=A0ABN5LNG0_9BACT|nr:phosphate ABC transporter substrate-binding protein [Chitinophaga alhagiae]